MLKRRQLLVRAAIASILVGVGLAPAFADPPVPTYVDYLLNPPTLPSTLQSFADSVKVATPADDVQHPARMTEWWYVNIVDPVTKSTFIIDFGNNNYASPDGPDNTISHSSTVWFDAQGVAESCHVLPCLHRNYITTPTSPLVASTTYPPALSSTAGSLAYVPAQHAYHLVYHWNGFAADVWLRHIKPGVTVPDTFIGWTVPVLTSDVTGWVKPPNAPAVSVNKWRGYHDHNFGNFDLFGQLYWKGYDWAVSHLPNGNATLMGGAVMSNGQYYGVVVSATKAGTRFCQGDLKMSDYTTVAEFTYPRREVSSCVVHPKNASVDYTGRGLSYSAPDPFLIRAGLFAFTETLGSTTDGSTALIEHFRNLSNYGVN